MEPKVFINLPVTDLQKAIQFYQAIGFSLNPQFTDDTAACMVFSDTIFVMLLTHEKFSMFISKPIADTKANAAGIFALSLDSAEKVNEIAENALNAGGREPIEAKDYGFMQQRSIEDLDGHLWEVLYMDMSKFPQQ